jgi:hypothetical protein
MVDAAKTVRMPPFDSLRRQAMTRGAWVWGWVAGAIGMGAALALPAAAADTSTKSAASAKPSTAPGGDLGSHVELAEMIVNLPNDWNIEATTKVLLKVTPKAADKDATGEFHAALEFNMGTVNKTPPAMAAFGASQQKTVAGRETGYKVLEKPTTATLGGVPGVKFGGTFKRGGAEVRSREYLLVTGNNRAYWITFTCLASKWSAYDSLVERCVATFKPKK